MKISGCIDMFAGILRNEVVGNAGLYNGKAYSDEEVGF